jgi:hypothetical protein
VLVSTSASGWLVRLDRAQHVVGARKLRTPGATAVAAAGDAVWVGYESGRLERRDVHSLDVQAATVSLVAIDRLTAGAGGVWLHGAKPAPALQWRTADLHLIRQWPYDVAQLAVGERYAAGVVDRGYVRLDLRTGAARRVGVRREVGGVALDGDRVLLSTWDGADARTFESRELETSRMLVRRQVGAFGELAVAGDLAWIFGDVPDHSSGAAVGVDPVTGQVVRRGGFETFLGNSCRGPRAGPGGVWGVNSFAMRLCRYDVH